MHTTCTRLSLEIVVYYFQQNTLRNIVTLYNVISWPCSINLVEKLTSEISVSEITQFPLNDTFEFPVTFTNTSKFHCVKLSKYNLKLLYIVFSKIPFKTSLHSTMSFHGLALFVSGLETNLKVSQRLRNFLQTTHLSFQ